MRNSIRQFVAIVVISVAVLGSQPASATPRSNDPDNGIASVVTRFVKQIKKLFHVSTLEEPLIPHP